MVRLLVMFRPRTDKPRYYKDANGEWRWQITARNNRRTHGSTEGFSSKTKARANFEMLLDAALAAYPFAVTEDAPRHE